MADVKKEFLDKEIESIIVDLGGGSKTLINSKDGKIERFEVCGEMSWVPWFRFHGKKYINEFNGKYVIAIKYKKDK